MGRPTKKKGPMNSALDVEGAFTEKRPDLTDGGLRPPYEEDGLRRFETPRTVPACKAVTLGDAMDGCPSVPRKIIMAPHVN